MKLLIANPKDQETNLDLLQFYQSFELQGQVNFKIRRLPDFFSYYATQSNKFRTYILRDENTNKIEACASFIITPALLNGEIVPIAYATDLRVSASRKAITTWGKHFLPVLNEVKEQLGAQHVFSAINLTDPGAYNTFIRPRNIKRPMPRYFLYRKFQLVGLHGRFPFSSPPLPQLRIRACNENYLEQLSYYLQHRTQYRPFSTVWNKESILQKIQSNSGYSLNNILIAFDSHENIVGCLGHWNPSPNQIWIPTTYTSMTAHNFRQFLKFGKYLGWTRPIAKPVASTGKENQLNFRFASILHADNEDIFESLLWVTYDSLPANEFLTYAHCNYDYRLRPPENWVYSTTPYALYSVIPPTSEIPTFLHPSQALNPEINLHFV